MKQRSRWILLVVTALLTIWMWTVTAAAAMDQSAQAVYGADDFDNQDWLLTELAMQIGHDVPFTPEELARIDIITIAGQDLEGCHIPAGIRLLSGLHTLELAGNNLEGSLEMLDHMDALRALDLRDNRFYGRLPDLSTAVLNHCDVSGNCLSGDVPFYYLFSPG